ncbi:TauD/TfdA family dioxygenase [Sporosarcina limicola]|uniref:Alpha-ketoglutarate-dependent taurine dioxygenase n=1 Tax=Sporosarcina limicola TaxID=34101 RepID=A0A927MM18_9BACL|nr:TauD/TfdA family dioxygenase [Sporosarcina limicola]MBE1556840.1 alpha-ketoglutarate-dependent taurine dioxygenase [Sporosarcina limicola]
MKNVQDRHGFNSVKIEQLTEGTLLPLLITPKSPNVDISIFVKKNEEIINSYLLKHGGILFRGFNVDSKEKLNRFVDINCSEILKYNESSSPRTEVGNKVYTSTDFPNDQIILQHNELSYSANWPMRIWFCSVNPSENGGETPISDVRQIYKKIDPKICETFSEKGWMLVRNYGDGFGLPWQQVFNTENREEVEKYCESNGIQVEWKDENRLRTRQIRKAIQDHPISGESVWFNHATFWHESSLSADVREMLISLLGREGLPYNTYYGDGSPIEDSVIEAIRKAYDSETITFPWQKGDLLMLDNMLVAHGRNSYTGSREILVSMGEPYSNLKL